MRISRKKKKPTMKKKYFFNERISTPQVLVLDENGSSLGNMKTSEALHIAREKELDLILINPKSNPPVAKFGDYGQFKYQKEKENRKKKARAHVTELKEVRLSVRIGNHDLEIRRKQSLKFLNNGDKVKVKIILRGRENKTPRIAFKIIQSFIDSINAIVKVRVEQPIEKQENKITAIITKE